jgi:hypothetical protein
VHDPRITRELVGQRQAGVTRGQEDVREHTVPFEREAVVDGPQPHDARRPHPLVPARALALLRDLFEEQLD